MDKKVKVIFPYLDKTIDISENTKISEACDAAGHPLNLVCGGKGKCKKCTVDIEDNGVIKTVLGCQTAVFDGLKIMLSNESAQAQILTESTLKGLEFDPSLKQVFLPSAVLKTEMAGNDLDTLQKALKTQLQPPRLAVVQKLSQFYHEKNGITCILHEDKLLDIHPGENDKLYALAFDIGTTTVVGYLYDMLSHKLIGISSLLNKQTQIGGDVISRIEYTINNPSGLEKLNSLVIDTVNVIINDLCEKNHTDKNFIYHATFGGNSTMQHLFLKIFPGYLGRIPFSSTTHNEVTSLASELRIDINQDGYITFLPLLGGFVGADTTAVLMSMPDDDKQRLIVDLGTNGEIGVGKGSHFKVASTACGPALEGAGLNSGMRGTTGAIERFSISGDTISYKVIGNVKPEGICGSGIIDIISELYKNGIVSGKGAINPPEKINTPEFAKRVIPWEKSKAFVVCQGDETKSGKPILITQTDIRQVQLAKGAISTGCRMLVEKSGLKLEDLDEILLAGAFGNYIDIKHAENIGMIPHTSKLSARSIGNAAGTGCQMHMLSRKKQKFCNDIAKNAEHIELASDPKFSSAFMINTSFDHDDELDI